jgi:WD40 repeat protein
VVQVATASADRTARVFDATSGTCLLTYRGHQGAVNSLDMTVQDKGRLEVMVASAGGDASVHLWQIPAETYT